MKAFKGFNKDLTCRGFQYEEGKEFHTEKADCCNEGFHACEYPLDCFGYYNPAESVFHEVELSGDMDREKGCILLIHFLPPQRVLSQMISLSLIVLSLLSIRELDQHRR